MEFVRLQRVKRAGYVTRMQEHRNHKRLLQSKWIGKTERPTKENVEGGDCRGYKEIGDWKLVEGGS